MNDNCLDLRLPFHRGIWRMESREEISDPELSHSPPPEVKGLGLRTRVSSPTGLMLPWGQNYRFSNVGSQLLHLGTYSTLLCLALNWELCNHTDSSYIWKPREVAAQTPNQSDFKVIIHPRQPTMRRNTCVGEKKKIENFVKRRREGKEK